MDMKIIFENRFKYIILFVVGIIFNCGLLLTYGKQNIWIIVAIFCYFLVNSIIVGIKLFNKNFIFLKPKSEEFEDFFKELGDFSYTDLGYYHKERFIEWASISKISILAIKPNNYFFERIEIKVSTLVEEKKYFTNERGIFTFYENLTKRYGCLLESRQSEMIVSFRSMLHIKMEVQLDKKMHQQ